MNLKTIFTLARVTRPLAASGAKARPAGGLTFALILRKQRRPVS